MPPRKRVGRTLRRTRATALQPIEENNVMEVEEEDQKLLDFAEPPVKKLRRGGTRKQQQQTTTMMKTCEIKRQQALHLLEEIETQMEKRCEEIMAEAERKVEELQMELKVQLMFLPEQVRAMKWKTFVEDFGASLEKVLQNVAPLQFSYSTTSVVQNEEEEDEDDKEGGDRRSVSICPATVISKPRGSASIMSTPAFIRKGPGASSNVFQTPASAVFSCKHPPSTILRTARKGETVYSSRGSPILPSTAVKAPIGSVIASFHEQTHEPTACLTLENDLALDLSNPAHQQQLSDETKAQAKAQLEALQAKVSALLQQLN